MKVGFIFVDGCIPTSFGAYLPLQVSELFICEHYDVETIVIAYAFEQKIPLTILTAPQAFTEHNFYIMQIDKLSPLCDCLVCFAQKDCDQLQWCVDYTEQMKIAMIVHKRFDNT